MSAYVDTVRKPPKTLTEVETAALLRVSGQSEEGFRDHVIFSVALGAALREHEIAALVVGDVSHDGANVRQRFPLRVYKRSNKDASAQEAIVPDALRYKLAKFLRWKKRRGESLAPDAPLFRSRQGGEDDAVPVTTRRIRQIFAHWTGVAGFDRHLSFHALRHTALSNLYRATKDIRLVQRVARHASIHSTTIYTVASDEDVLRAMRAQPC